jgi:hypothetical protein
MSAEPVTSFDRTQPVPDGSAPYIPHRPEQSLLHRVIREQIESFLVRSRDRGHPAPRFVEQELRAFLRCGVLAHGFLRLHCDDCGCDRLVPFSCKRRGFCPSCGGRRMADTAAHLVDRVLPEVPIRQWVLTLPYPLRYRCAYDAKLASAVLRAFVRALFAELRRRVRRHCRALDLHCGAVTFLQRFGSALNLNLHFHTLALDGAHTGIRGPDAPTRFLPLPPPDDDEVARVLAGTARRLQRLLAERAGEDEDAFARDEPLLALLAAASLRGRSASGPNSGERWRRLGDRVEPADGNDDPKTSRRVPQLGGMSLHAAVAVPALDRRRLERLCRYVARPPLANERLEELPDGRLALRQLARPGRTGWRCRHPRRRVRARSRDEGANRPVPKRRFSERTDRTRRGHLRSRNLERSRRTAYPGSRRGGPRSRPARHRTERWNPLPPPVGRIAPARVRRGRPPLPPLWIDDAHHRRHRRPRHRPQDPRVPKAPRTRSAARASDGGHPGLGSGRRRLALRSVTQP